MALDVTGMESRQARQLNLGEEPIYCAAYDDGEEVLCLGSDQALSQPERIAQRLRYEDQALRYLRGQRPLLLSAALMGPFDRASGWQNPWLPASQVNEPAAYSVQGNAAQSSTSAVAVPKAISRVHARRLDDSARQTTATEDSVLCHLPSPDSQREFELAKDPHLDTEARSRIGLWAKNVPAGTLERNKFWAPDESKAETSDDSALLKRPAGKEWLKSKLQKRRRTETTSFESAPTPTPGLLSVVGTKSATRPVTSRIVDPSETCAAASRSFEQTTPASSSEEQTAGDMKSAVRRNSSQDGKARSKIVRQQGKTKVRAWRKRIKNQLQQLSESTSSKMSLERPSDLLSQQPLQAQPENPEAITATSNSNIPHIELHPNHNPRYTSPIQIDHETDELDQSPLEPDKISFESHVDHSFQYKARAVKQTTEKLPTDSASDNRSQPTETGGPESNDGHRSAIVQDQLRENDDLEADIVSRLTDQAVEQAGVFSSSCPPKLNTDKGVLKDTSDVPEKKETDETDEIEGPLSSKFHTALDGTTIGGGDPRSSHSRRTYAEPFKAQAFGCDDEMDSPARKETAQTASRTPQTSIHNLMIDAMLGEDSTLIGDAIDVDSSTPLQANMPATRLEAVKHSSQSLHGSAPVELLVPPSTCKNEEVPKLAFSDRQPSTWTRDPSHSPADGRQTEPVQSTLLELTKHAVDVPSQASVPDSPATTLGTTPTHQHGPPQEWQTRASTDCCSEHGSSAVVVPLSQTEQMVASSKDIPSRSLESHPESLGIGASGAAVVNEYAKQDTAIPESTLVLQSPWAPFDHKWEAGLLRKQGHGLPSHSSSNPGFIATAEVTTIPPSQQEPWAPTTNEPSSAAASKVSPVSRLLPLVAQQHLECASVPNGNVAVVAADQKPASDSQSLHSEVPQMNTPKARGAWIRSTTSPVDVAMPSSGSCSFNTGQSRQSAVPITPRQQGDRQSTPEPDLSIKSFANFNTPPPKRQRSVRQSNLSGDRLPSTQILVDAANSNPWDSSKRSSLRSTMHRGSSLRVSFAPLPGTDSDVVDASASSEPLCPTVGRAASPPPLSTGDIGDEDLEAGHFHKHFDIMKQRAGTSRGTPKLRPVSRLLPSESQQKPMSPEIGMMAQAFRDADEGRALRSSLDSEIAVDEESTMLDYDGKDRSQSPWLNDNQSQGIDDISAVLHNLDDFLNPRWDVEAEMDKAKVADGIENQRRERTPDLLGHNVWAGF